MPSKSASQARLMRAAAHGWEKPGGGGPSESVAKEFVSDDKKRGKFGSGGRPTRAKINKQNTRHGKLDMPFSSVNKFAGMKEGGSVADEKEHAQTLMRIASEELKEKHMAKGGGVESKGKTKGKMIKMAKGGSVGSASKRADGCAMKGKTKGRIC